MLAKVCAKAFGFPCETYPVDLLHGTAAVERRNETMLNLDGVIGVVAFVPAAGMDPRTENLVRMAEKRRVPVKVVDGS